MENVKAIKVMLRCFELMSGLKINFAKSSFGAFGTTEHWINNAASYLNCRRLSIPFSYLGIPIGANPRHSETWDAIVKKCERKLSKWKQKYLFWGNTDFEKVSLELNPNFLLLFFQGAEEGGGRAGKATEVVLVGRKLKSQKKIA